MRREIKGVMKEEVAKEKAKQLEMEADYLHMGVGSDMYIDSVG